MPRPLHHLLRPATFLLLSVLSLAVAQLCQAEPSAEKKDKQHPEKPYALIFGTVWGPDSRPVYGVKIKCRRADQKKSRWELYSDHNGEFAFRVPAGKAEYLVTADLKGYKPLDGKHFQAPPEVTVHIENDERTDIGVHLK
jgi:hypothetical protein